MEEKVILNEYRGKICLYKRLIEEIIYILKPELERIKIISVPNRIKDEDKFLEKIKRKQSCDPFQDIKDIAGIRIVCLYSIDLEKIEDLVNQKLHVLTSEDKQEGLGVDRMGYASKHLIVKIPDDFSGSRYDEIKNLNCEIQIRTGLQDSWANISHELDYKSEHDIPNKIKRNLLNVSALLEIAQQVFDNAYEQRNTYQRDLEENAKQDTEKLLDEPINFDSLISYSTWKFMELPPSEHIANLIIADINHEKYKIIKDIDNVVEQAKEFTEKYKSECPHLFRYGTDYISKSLGFVDEGFRAKHAFCQQTKEAFLKFNS